jgi:hypothetical protein
MVLNTIKLISVGTISTSSIPKRLKRLATQKKKPLIINELILSFSISTKARDTKELKPALRTMITKIKKMRFWSIGI